MFFDLDDYTIGFAAIAEINREDPNSWEIKMITGGVYTLEGEDLERFKTEFKGYRAKG